MYPKRLFDTLRFVWNPICSVTVTDFLEKFDFRNSSNLKMHKFLLAEVREKIEE